MVFSKTGLPIRAWCVVVFSSVWALSVAAPLRAAARSGGPWGALASQGAFPTAAAPPTAAAASPGIIAHPALLSLGAPQLPVDTSAGLRQTKGAADSRGKVDSRADDGGLKRSHLVVGIIAAIVGAILGGIINLIVSAWRGWTWGVFAALESDAGRERLMRIVAPSLKTDAERNDLVFPALESIGGRVRLMEIVLTALQSDTQRDKIVFSALESTPGRQRLMDIVLPALELPAGQGRVAEIVFKACLAPEGKERLADIILDHFRTRGKNNTMEWVLETLESTAARERLATLVANLMAARDDSRQIVQKNVQAVMHSASSDAPQNELDQSQISHLAEDPLFNREHLAQFFNAAVQFARQFTSPLPPPADPDPGSEKGEPPQR